jgi:hypothetical protein
MLPSLCLRCRLLSRKVRYDSYSTAFSIAPALRPCKGRAQFSSCLASSPPVKSEPGAEGEEESDSDDELEAGGATQNFKDPLTYTTLKEPYTSSVPFLASLLLFLSVLTNRLSSSCARFPAPSTFLLLLLLVPPPDSPFPTVPSAPTPFPSRPSSSTSPAAKRAVKNAPTPAVKPSSAERASKRTRSWASVWRRLRGEKRG